MARLVHWLFLLAFVPLALSTISKFDLRGSTSRLRAEGNLVPKTIPMPALPSELARIRLRRNHEGQPSSHPYSLDDPHDSAVILYSGTDQKVIFLLTYSGQASSSSSYTSNLYRSTDYGYTYERINSRLEPQNPNNLQLYSQFYVSPEDNKQIVFPHHNVSVMYVTTDEGGSFTKVSMDKYGINPQSIMFHPTNGQTLLGYNATTHNLYVSHDLGSSFTHVASSVFSFTWGIPGYDRDVSTIFYLAGARAGFVQLYQTSDKNVASSILFDPSLGPIVAFVIVDSYIFCLKSDISLWVSYKRQPFKQALFPSEETVQQYLVTTVPDVMAIVVAQQASGIYNLYTSDEEGQHFAESLSDIYVSDDYIVDVELVDSMNYTFIANQNMRTDDGSVTDPPRRTLISFYNAGIWEIVKPPQTYLNGSYVTCEPPSCSLHLHMFSGDYARLGIYSQESAPGIIVAHGTIGQQLADNPDLFLSRDGGVTWIMTLGSSWGVSVLDHGGLLVAAADYHQNPSTQLLYSCDEGGSWTSFEFYDHTMTVYGVITEPGETTTVVSLFGMETIGSGWEVILVNFSNVFERVCTEQDYYYWNPYDENFHSSCLLGATVTIERRQPSICCLNGMDYDRSIGYSQCPCSVEDFECDFGYMPSSIGGGACVRDPSVIVQDPCVNGQVTYQQSQGYRKIPGDVCSSGDESLFAKITTKCCLSPPGNGTTPTSLPAEVDVTAIILGVFLFLAVLMVVVLLVTLFMFICKVMKKNHGDGYHRVGLLSFNADESNSLPGDTDDDDDENLLNA